MTPIRYPSRATAALTDSSAPCSRACWTSRIARAGTFCGYLLSAGMIIKLSGNRTLRQTRGGSLTK
ncbi:hypothetical protein GCM10011512_24870 [Tersicoccus solisilvae]|uniref:Uncharacterized protein n=1 Tax=Tersicoccus solisilvae TaxID=1882339 RepID=A0ABQ1PGU2_9MICC|nr:hypothetical protein GCM10011512_24870 [Tersicoccus solisilvae]